MKLIPNKKDGYVLIWVLCIFLVVSIISTLIVSSALISTSSTLNQHNYQQAYYTAKSAAHSVAQYILNNIDNDTLINNLMNNQGSGSIENMGDYTVDVSYANTEKIKVSAKSTYKNQTSEVTVYLVKSLAPSGKIPTDNIIFINGSADTGIGQCGITGDVYVNGNMSLSEGSSVSGFVVVKGTTNISGAGNTTSGIFSFGNVTLSNGGIVNGDLYTNGDITMSGSAKVAGSAYADGSLNLTDGTVISSNAYIRNNVNLSGGCIINGTLYYGGTVNNVSYVTGGAVKSTDLIDVDESSYTAQELPIVIAPTQSQMPELYNTVVINNDTISNSGTITDSVVSQLNSTYGKTFTIDATTKDINLLLANTNLNLTSGINLEVISNGTHNVFIYMTGTSSIRISSNEYMGMQDIGTNPRLYIFGDGEQTVSLDRNSELDACVYIPNGAFSASGSEYLTKYKFIGSCTAKSINISSDVLFYYSKPEIDNTPLSVFVTDNSGYTESAWGIESWGAN